MVAWPATVPFSPQVGQLQIVPEDNIVRFKPDAGPEQRRRRFSSAVHAYNFPVVMTSAQLATFEAFYATTLASGSLAFDMEDPKTGATRSFWFAAPYQIEALPAIGAFKVTLSLATLVTP